MIGLVYKLLLIVAYFEASIDIIRAYKWSEQMVHIKDIPTLEQEETVEKIKTEWLTNFNRLPNETQDYREIKI